MVVRAALEERARGVRERLLEPGVEVAAVGERAALDDAALVEPVHEEPRPRLRPLRLVEDAQRARGADHERRARRAGAAGAEIRAGAVDRAPGTSRRSARARGAAAATRRRRARRAARRPTAGRRGRAARCRRRSRGSRRQRCRAAARRGSRRTRRSGPPTRKDLGLRLREPGELRRPEARMEVRAGARVHDVPSRAGAGATRPPPRSACPASRGSRSAAPVRCRARAASARSTRCRPRRRPRRGRRSPSRTSATISSGSRPSYLSCFSSSTRLRALVEALGAHG